MSIEGDKLRGRGTTDCLGHVALIALLMKKLGETKPQLKSTVVAVFIANEENPVITGIGVDGLGKAGLLDHLKGGPLYVSPTVIRKNSYMEIIMFKILTYMLFICASGSG